MSAGLAQASADDDRAAAIAQSLRSHECVDDARLAGDWLLMVPSERGAGVLRRYGKAALLERCRAALPGSQAELAARLRWRLLESLPAAGSSVEAACMQPIRQPTVRALEALAAGSLRCEFRVPFDLAVFEGHFPVIPVVPAVTQIGWALDLARQHLGCGGRVAGIVGAKFRRLMQPGMPLVLMLEIPPGRDRLRFEYCTAGAPVSTGRLALVAAND